MLSVRVAGSIPAGFIERFREIGAEVDPALQLRRVVPLSTFYNDVRSVWRYLAWGIGLVDDERAAAVGGGDLSFNWARPAGFEPATLGLEVTPLTAR